MKEMKIETFGISSYHRGKRVEGKGVLTMS